MQCRCYIRQALRRITCGGNITFSPQMQIFEECVGNIDKPRNGTQIYTDKAPQIYADYYKNPFVSA